jgi:hypothetical protein
LGASVKRANQKVLDLGFCPRCKDFLDDLKGLKSRVVASVKFCVFCSMHVELDKKELDMYVKWAQTQERYSNLLSEEASL